MAERKIKIARLWSRYNENIPSRSGIIMGLDTSRFETICVYLMRNSDKPNYFEQKGLKAYYISRKKFLRIFNLLAIWKLSRILKREKNDILHCHRYQATIYGAVAALLAGTKVVISHVHGISRTKDFRRKLTNFFVLRWINKIVTVGQAVREDVLKANPHVKPDKVISIGNSIDYEHYADVSLTKAQAKEALSLPSNSFVFGTIGRLAPTKGHSYLIRAFSKVKQVIPEAQLVFIGDGRLRRELEAQAAETAPNSIHFLGYRSDVPQLLRTMDVFVLPSVAEGLPKVLLEAIVMGVPCLASEVGGIPEIITNNKTGFLVPPKNESALAEAMIKLAKMPEKERQKLIDNAKEKVCKSYNHRVVIKRIENIYETEYKAGGN